MSGKRQKSWDMEKALGNDQCYKDLETHLKEHPDDKTLDAFLEQNWMQAGNLDFSYWHDGADNSVVQVQFALILRSVRSMWVALIDKNRRG